jgi:nitrogen regulatory protein PII
MTANGMGPIKYVVIICEEAIEPLIGDDIMECGASGYTVSTVRGRGVRGVRDARTMLSSNIRIEVLCTAVVAQKLLDTAYRKYAKHYGLVGFMQDATVPNPQGY